MGRHITYPAQVIIHKLYGSYPSARRVHYLLKEQGWFDYTGYYILELYFNKGKPVYLTLRDPDTNEELYSYGSKPGDSEKYIKLVVIPGEHIEEENEETYFYRPAGLY